jgi:hypothetical protein
MPLTASFAPWTMFTTPSGRPASISSSTIRCDDSGVRSEGLSTYVLPAPMAIGMVHSGIIAGKLNGTMAATTPSGKR